MLSHDVPGIICGGRGGGCCGLKALSLMCHRGGGKLYVARQGAFNQVIFARIWWGSGQRSETTLLFLFVRSQGRFWRVLWLCCDGCPGPFCGQSLLRSGLGEGRDVYRDFCGGRDGLLQFWDRGWLRPGLAPGDTDAGTPELGWVLLWVFLWDSFLCSMAPLASADVWLGTGGTVEAFGGMVARALFFGGMALRRPQNGPSEAKETRYISRRERRLAELWERRAGLQGSVTSFEGYAPSSPRKM